MYLCFWCLIFFSAQYLHLSCGKICALHDIYRLMHDKTDLDVLLQYITKISWQFYTLTQNNCKVNCAFQLMFCFISTRTREDGTDTLFRNVGKQLQHDAA
jgi:hypothetical protein